MTSIERARLIGLATVLLGACLMTAAAATADLLIHSPAHSILFAPLFALIPQAAAVALVLVAFHFVMDRTGEMTDTTNHEAFCRKHEWKNIRRIALAPQRIGEIKHSSDVVQRSPILQEPEAVA
ncbi:MAG TPA: hypothetical protein VGJ15_13970 [Pirellulales bacterium]